MHKAPRASGTFKALARNRASRPRTPLERASESGRRFQTGAFSLSSQGGSRSWETMATSQKACGELERAFVPALAATLQRYLDSLVAVVSSPAQMENTRRLVHQFMHGQGNNTASQDGKGGRDPLGPLLQEKLKLFASSRDNWVTDLWLDDMYLNNSQPLPVNSSPFYLFPKQCFATSADQARFAARFIEFAVLFKRKIDSGTLTPDVGRGAGQLQCMQTYKHFFPAYRRPGPTKDDLLLDTASQHQDHVIVVCRDQFFKLRLPLDQGGPLDVEALTRQLLSIKQQAKDPSERQPPVGAFTTEQRRTWAGIYAKLARSNVNQSSLQCLETCLLVVCLDRPLSSLRLRHYASLRRESVTLDLGAQAAHLLHGGSVADGNAANRWYDKFMQIVVSRDGINGLICEHSASEGVTVIRFCEEFLQHMQQQYQQQPQAPPPGSPSIRASSVCAQYPVSRLSWDLGDDVLKALQDSTKAINTLAEDVDLYILHFPNYGKNFIKEQRISPDVYIQLALQLTYYKVHRKLVSTYESASLRKFHLGRVDNIRAATAEALAFVQAMCDAVPATEEDKIKLFLEAVAKGTEILTYTVNGDGPDNHLLGLREMARLHEMPAAIFSDKSYADFLHFRLSTSQKSLARGIAISHEEIQLTLTHKVKKRVLRRAILFFSTKIKLWDFFVFMPFSGCLLFCVLLVFVLECILHSLCGHTF
ncbi:vesicular acetylcholine transporter isoform X2 [Amblyomma americanum]